jgi:flagellar export protein FliJ
MKRFVFPLEQIRAWNAAKLQVEEAALEAVVNQLRKAEADYSSVCAQRSEFERQTLQQSTIASSELLRIGQFRDFVVSEGRRLEAARAEFNKQIAARRSRVIELRRKIELFDRLKQRQKASWTAEETKELQTAADEAFLQRIVAKRV